MSIIKFGQYLVEIESPKFGQELILDGYDGFDDQTLWHYKKGSQIQFIINPNSAKSLINHKFLITEVLEDTNNYDCAKVLINTLTTLNGIFENKPINDSNEVIGLINSMSDLWNKTFELKNKIKDYRYRPFNSPFLTFKELEQVFKTGEINITKGSKNELSRIYAKIITDNCIRIISVSGNCPESCILYDINNFEQYKSEINRMKRKNQWIDEVNFWNRLIVK